MVLHVWSSYMFCFLVVVEYVKSHCMTIPIILAFSLFCNCSIAIACVALLVRWSTAKQVLETLMYLSDATEKKTTQQ